LDIVDSLGGRFQDWAKVTPRHQSFIDAILQSKCHVITTVRRKQDYEIIKDGNKTKVEKAGLKEQTREGFEYELTVNLELDHRHNATVSKDRTGLFAGKPAFVPDVSTGKLIYEWCESGATPAPLSKLAHPAMTTPQLKKAMERITSGEPGVYEKITSSFTLTEAQQTELNKVLQLLKTA
jgi:hypothetical protein